MLGQFSAGNTTHTPHRTKIYSSRDSVFLKRRENQIGRLRTMVRVWSNEGNCKRNNAIMATRRGLGQVRSLV